VSVTAVVAGWEVWQHSLACVQCVTSWRSKYQCQTGAAGRVVEGRGAVRIIANSMIRQMSTRKSVFRGSPFTVTVRRTSVLPGWPEGALLPEFAEQKSGCLAYGGEGVAHA
jgi:hypothetical protein